MYRRCAYCNRRLGNYVYTHRYPSGRFAQFCSETHYLRYKHGVPKIAVEESGVHGARIGHSELAMFAGKAGRIVDRLWSINNGSYGYATLTDGGFIHGSLTINGIGHVSLA